MKTCQYCNEVKASLDHICSVRLKELSTNGVSPGRPAIVACYNCDGDTLNHDNWCALKRYVK